MEMALNLLPNNAMTFTENQHGTAVLEKLKSQRELVRCCDVVLHVAGNQFQAHRCVLAACSPYFDSIFKAGKTVKEQLTITSQDPEVFHCLLAYMYTGTVVVDKTNVAELLRLANRLLIAKLKEHCAEYLERYLDATNCLTVRDMATKYNLKALEKTTGTFIQTHLSEVVEGDEVLEMSHTRLEDFLRCPNWHLHEDQTLLLVTRWVHHCPKSRERNLRSLLTWVQWSHLNPETPIHLIQSHPLYMSSSRLALFFLLDALNEHSLLPSAFLTSFSNLKAKFSQSADSVVDNESFFSLAISTAIDELQEDQLSGGRNQEVMPTVTDFSTHTGPFHSAQNLPLDPDDLTNPTNLTMLSQLHKPSDFHITSRRDGNDQDTEQCNQYDSCRIIHNSQDIHGNPPSSAYSQPGPSGKENVCHTHISEGLVGDSESVEDGKFSCNSQGHFGQPLVRNMTVWHQEPPYSAEESLSSDSSQMYQRQVYDQNFSMKTQCPESFNTRVNPQAIYTLRETPHKNKPGFASAMSHYVSTYNPDEDMTVSDDQSTQSFPYDENFNPGMNFYTCRSSDVKESQHLMIESHHSQENYAMSYYHDDLATAQDVSCTQPDVYYNENSTDTQISNCPQDMTIQVKDLPQNLETEVAINSENTRINTLSERMLADDPHYDHYPLKTNVVESKFHRDAVRPVEEPVLSIGPRDIVPQEFLLDGKRLAADCDLEARGIVTVVGGTLEGDKTYKGCSLENGEKFYKEPHTTDGKEFTKNEPGENIRDPLALSIEVTSLERHHTHVVSSIENTPRQVKFKMNRSCSQGVSGFLSSTSQDLTVSSEPSLPSNAPVTDIIDMIKIETHEVDPDDPQIVLNGREETSSKKELKENQVNTEPESGDTLSSTVNERENVGPAVKETLRKICRKEKITLKNKEKKKEGASTSERVCEVCRASFLQTRLYFSHMREHFPGPPHSCDTCKASFKRIYHLLEHRVIHQDAKVHKCPHCPFRAHKKFNLTEHLTQHSKSRKFKCKICGDSFSRIQNLHIHETKHTSERPFLCESCGWSGKTKNSLIIHTKKHTGELLRCQYSACTYATAKKSHLKEHMLKHSNSRLFTCGDCGHSFITNSHLRRHVKQHLLEKPFKCPQCDYSSPRQDRLKVHIKKKHAPKESATVQSKKKMSKKNNTNTGSSKHQTVVTSSITAHIECSQADIFSDLDNTNISLQPQLSGTPPPTTLSEYPPSPSYTFPSQSAPEDSLIIVSDMASVTEGFAPLNQTYEGSYHSPQYQTSPSHFAALSPTQTTLSYSNGHNQEESPLNFAACMKYD
uniref:BTB domain-containing protein n=1 Tax=Scylla olivacea TaxID=85551 RepID=A0A0P4W956_SCYOL